MKSSALHTYRSTNKIGFTRKNSRSSTEFNIKSPQVDQSSRNSTAKNSFKASPSKSPSPDINFPQASPITRKSNRSNTEIKISKPIQPTNAGKGNLKISLINSIFSDAQSNFPNSLDSSPVKIIRKDSRSQTEVNTPMNGPNYNTFTTVAENNKNPKVAFVRQNSRNKTEVIVTDPNRSMKSNCQNTGNRHIQNESLKKNAENLKKTASTNKLAYKYKLEQVPARVLQKEKRVIENPIPVDEITVHDIKFQQAEENFFTKDTISGKDIIKKTINDKDNVSVFKQHRRCSIGSNGSMMFSEAHHEVLYELTKSVQELNQRLIKNEEISINRLQENVILKNTIKNLEGRLEDHKDTRLDREGVRVGCTNGCLVF